MEENQVVLSRSRHLSKQIANPAIDRDFIVFGDSQRTGHTGRRTIDAVTVQVSVLRQ